MTSRFVLDGSYRRTAGGALIVGGSPLRLYRLSPAGQTVAAALEAGTELPANHRALTDRLVDGGAIHPLPAPGAIPTADATVVVPAFGQLPLVDDDGGAGEVVVVDDASVPPLPAGPGRRMLRLPVNGGPAAARNAGLAAVTSPFVAFVDTDVELPPGWLGPLLGHFADERVALVAPRVCTTPSGSALVDAIEAERGSLDLGATPARIAAGSRVGYVPAAAIVCRTAALRWVGGFDEALRWGEDVDLVWRLVEAGWRCRYEPSVTVGHRARPTVRAWLRQQFAYGTSAAPLAARHPGALAPLRISGWSLAAWILAVGARRPLAGAALTVATAVALQRKLPGVPPAEVAELAGRGTLAAGEQIANAVTRAWWPVALLLLPVRGARLPVTVALLAPPVLGAWRARDVQATSDGSQDLGAAAVARRLGRSAVLRLAADLAYGAGVWRGALGERAIGALAPDLSNWPPRRPAAGASTLTHPPSGASQA